MLVNISESVINGISVAMTNQLYLLWAACGEAGELGKKNIFSQFTVQRLPHVQDLPRFVKPFSFSHNFWSKYQ
jgi:hypothetical protein